jgi:acetolactate synthase-1/2/3 large subunit
MRPLRCRPRSRRRAVSRLVLPADCAGRGRTAGGDATPGGAQQWRETICDMARVLRSGEAAMLVLSGEALGEAGLRAAQRVAYASGAKLRTPTQVPRMARGRGRAPVDRIPYGVDAALKVLAGTKHLILAGAKAPVGFFAYPGKPSTMWPRDCALHVLARVEQDVVAALEALADELGAPRVVPSQGSGPAPEVQRGPFKPDAFGHTLAALLPEQAIVAEDAVTPGRALSRSPSRWLRTTDPADGRRDHTPCATARPWPPERKVVCPQADGANVPLQALWTQAREHPTSSTSFANRRLCDPARQPRVARRPGLPRASSSIWRGRKSAGRNWPKAWAWKPCASRPWKRSRMRSARPARDAGRSSSNS